MIPHGPWIRKTLKATLKDKRLTGKKLVCSVFSKGLVVAIINKELL